MDLNPKPVKTGYPANRIDFFFSISFDIHQPTKHTKKAKDKIRTKREREVLTVLGDEDEEKQIKGNEKNCQK